MSEYFEILDIINDIQSFGNMHMFKLYTSE
jgi:hypothetical protein